MRQRLCVFINIVLIGFLAWYFFIHKDFRAFYEKRFDPQENFLEDIYYRAKVDSYAVMNAIAKDEKVVFAGDSIMEQFPVHELFPGAGVLNRGIGMDTSRGILLRLEDNVNNLTVSLFSPCGP